MSDWEPYFRPTRKVHESGFRCFECGYLVIGNDRKATKKVVISDSVDHILNWLMNYDKPTRFDMDLLLDGNIRVFNHKHDLFWYIPGWSDAEIVADSSQAWPSYVELDKIYKRQKEEKND